MNKKCIIACLAFGIFFFNIKADEVKVFFNKDCEKALIDEIASAQKSIHVAIYSFTRFNIANALVRASKRGVEVKIIWDKSQLDSSEYGPKIFDILKNGKVQVHLSDRKSKMHHKFTIIDKVKIINGSFNYTTSATNFNDENLVVFKNAKAAEKFLKAWEGILLQLKKE